MKLIRDGEYPPPPLGIIRPSLHCHHHNDSCIKMGSDESHFNVSLTVRDKVTRQCPQTTTSEEKGEPKWNRTVALLLTRLTAGPNRLTIGNDDVRLNALGCRANIIIRNKYLVNPRVCLYTRCWKKGCLPKDLVKTIMVSRYKSKLSQVRSKCFNHHSQDKSINY